MSVEVESDVVNAERASAMPSDRTSSIFRERAAASDRPAVSAEVSIFFPPETASISRMFSQHDCYCLPNMVFTARLRPPAPRSSCGSADFLWSSNENISRKFES